MLTNLTVCENGSWLIVVLRSLGFCFLTYVKKLCSHTLKKGAYLWASWTTWVYGFKMCGFTFLVENIIFHCSDWPLSYKSQVGCKYLLLITSEGKYTWRQIHHENAKCACPQIVAGGVCLGFFWDGSWQIFTWTLNDWVCPQLRSIKLEIIPNTCCLSMELCYVKFYAEVGVAMVFPSLDISSTWTCHICLLVNPFPELRWTH